MTTSGAPSRSWAASCAMSSGRETGQLFRVDTCVQEKGEVKSGIKSDIVLGYCRKIRICMSPIVPVYNIQTRL